MPFAARTLSVMSSTLPKPSVATLSVFGFARASFSNCAQSLKRPFYARKRKEGHCIMMAMGVMSFTVQHG